jgi:hypothetical protein
MAASDKVFVAKKLTLTGSFQAAYTASNERVFVSSRIVVANTNNAAVTVRLCYVPFTSPVTAAGQTNARMWDHSIPANTEVELKSGEMIPRAGSIQASAGTANVVNLLINGFEES